MVPDAFPRREACYVLFRNLLDARVCPSAYAVKRKAITENAATVGLEVVHDAFAIHLTREHVIFVAKAEMIAGLKDHAPNKIV